MATLSSVAFPASGLETGGSHVGACNKRLWRNRAGMVRCMNTSSSSSSSSSSAPSFKVTLLTPAGERTLDVPADMYIADAAEAAGVTIPLSCRSGACSSCAALLKAGAVDQSDQTYLDHSQIQQGFVLTCVAYPVADAVLETHQEHLLY